MTALIQGQLIWGIRIVNETPLLLLCHKGIVTSGLGAMYICVPWNTKHTDLTSISWIPQIFHNSFLKPFKELCYCIFYKKKTERECTNTFLSNSCIIILLLTVIQKAKTGQDMEQWSWLWLIDMKCLHGFLLLLYKWWCHSWVRLTDIRVCTTMEEFEPIIWNQKLEVISWYITMFMKKSKSIYYNIKR